MTLKQIFQNLKDLGIVDKNGKILPAFEDIIVVKDLKKIRGNSFITFKKPRPFNCPQTAAQASRKCRRYLV